MKRYGNIMEKIYSYDNLLLAYEKAKKGKAWYKEVLDFEKDIEGNLLKLQDSLVSGLYTTSKYEIFDKVCGNKIRTIYKLPFYPDRICQWAIMIQLEPIFLKKFTKDTYSAIPNRGIHLALKRMKRELRIDPDGMKYCLKLDIKKYYPNINHNILKAKLNKTFKDKDLLSLIGNIIDSLPDGVGLPIGNYTSQYFANYYLNDFDRWLKEELRIKHYFRYMDDVCIFSNSKKELHLYLDMIRAYLKNNLKLELKGNEQIFPVEKRGVDFVGYVIYKDHVLLRKSIKNNMKKKSREIMKKDKITLEDIMSINSYGGWLKHCDCKRLHELYIKPILNRYDKEF